MLDNACNSNPCLNLGTCQQVGSGFLCLCPQYYSGTNCQICKLFDFCPETKV